MSDLIGLRVQVLYIKSYYGLVIKSIQSELSFGIKEYICTFYDITESQNHRITEW